MLLKGVQLGAPLEALGVDHRNRDASSSHVGGPFQPSENRKSFEFGGAFGSSPREYAEGRSEIERPLDPTVPTLEQVV